jgi:hypothetical protein
MVLAGSFGFNAPSACQSGWPWPAATATGDLFSVRNLLETDGKEGDLRPKLTMKMAKLRRPTTAGSLKVLGFKQSTPTHTVDRCLFVNWIFLHEASSLSNKARGRRLLRSNEPDIRSKSLSFDDPKLAFCHP